MVVKKYIISTDGFGESNVKCLNSEEFMNFYLKDKPCLDDVSFVGDSKEIEKMKVVFEFLRYYEETLVKLNNSMKNYNDLYVREDNVFIKEAMEQFASSNSGGKFLRGFLACLGYNIFNGDGDDYIPLSVALEFFQTSVLIHDDIIDKASTRRGRDTIPVKYSKIYSDPINYNDSFDDKLKGLSDSMALCIGDIGLYLTNQILINNYSNRDVFGRLFGYYNDMAIKTCKGELIDVALPFYEEFYGTDDLEKHIMEIYKLKTGWYSVVGPTALGGILAGGSDENIHALEDALMNLGIAYQIKDDLLGIYGDEEKTGKSILTDVEEFKQTLLYSYAVSHGYKDSLLEVYGKDNLSFKDIEKVRKIFDSCGSKKYCLDMMDFLFKDSFECILSLDFIDTHFKKILLGFAEFLRVRRS